ncbi:very large A-kinase anchor protein isoform X2 [Sceloporus undulatus]|uniref:very large A-kinase anchor protein isoform X2 n=1 Tax=Sceloporus undulatus TaxID=8520 RepID=UPI001C4A8336|nr:very large A-kinase anchor protein isoform X2 [Sceloporus undulatus]
MSGGSHRRKTGSFWPGGFSRLFSRSPSKEAEESGEGAPEENFEAKANESTNELYQGKESNPLPELLKFSICENKNLSTEELSRSTTQEELKKANSLPSLAHESKTTNNERQIKEGFFQYLGSLFGISSKSSLKQTEQPAVGNRYDKTANDFASLSSHQTSGHTECLKPEIFVISSSESEKEHSNKSEEINLAKRTSCGSQDLHKRQEEFPEAPEKTACELGAPAVTYATYRGSSRIKQLLKKQADLEQEEAALSNFNISTLESKENQTVNIPDSDMTTTKTESLLIKNSNTGTKYDEKDSQSSIAKVGMDLENHAQEVLNSSKYEELKKKSTLLTEMETVKNCIEELVSMKNVSLSNTPEVSGNSLLEPILLPKEVNYSCQNIDPVRMSLENNKLVEKREEVLGEMQMQLQANNANVVGFQKGMHFYAFSNTETKETVQFEFSSHPKVDSSDNEQQLLENKYSCYSSKMVNKNEDLYKNMLTEQNEQSLQTILPNDLDSVSCKIKSNKTIKLSGRTDASTSVQPSDTVQGTDSLRKKSSENDETTMSVVLRDIQNNPNFSIISEIGMNDSTTDNLLLHVVESENVGPTKALTDDTMTDNTNTSLLTIEYENVKSKVKDSALETGETSTDRAVLMVDACPQKPENKGSYHHLVKKDEEETLTNTSASLDVSFPLIELEETRFINNTESCAMMNHIPSPFKNTEVVEIKSPVTAAEQNVSLVNEMRDHAEAKVTPLLETKEVITMSPNEVCSLKDSTVVKPEKYSSSVFPSHSLPTLVSSSFIFEADNIILDTVSKPVNNFEDQSELKTSCSLSNKQEGISECMKTPAITDFSVTEHGNIGLNPIHGNVHIISKSKISGSSSTLLATDVQSEDTNNISEFFLETAGTIKTKIPLGSSEEGVKNKIAPCFEKRKDITGSCSMDLVLVKEDPLVITLENICNCKSATIATCPKDISKPSSPSCETVDAVSLDEINPLPINSEDVMSSISLKHKSDCLASESASKATCPPPLLDSIPCDMEATEPVKMTLGLSFTTEQYKKVQKIPSEQLNLHNLADAVSEHPSERDDQAIAALFTKSSSQVFEEPLKNVETGKQVQIKSQDLTVLLKKADEIVDAVLHLAIEEIRSNQTDGVCQTNDIKGNLLGGRLQKDQNIRKKMPESKEMQSRNSLLKSFNESCIRKLSGFKEEGTRSIDIQDETIPFDTTDKTDLHSSIALIAKEIIDDAINAAKQKLTYNLHEDHLRKTVSQNAGEVTNFLAPLYIKVGDGNKELTAEEIITKKVVPCQKNGDEWFDSTAAVKSSDIKSGQSNNNQSVSCTPQMIKAGDNTSNQTADSKSEKSLHEVKGETLKTKEQIALCPSEPVNLLPFNSNVDTYSCTSLGSNVEKDLPKFIFKDDIAVHVREPHENFYEISSKRDHGEINKSCTMPQDKNKFGILSNMNELSLMNSSVKIGLNPEFLHKEEAVVGPDLHVANMFKECYVDVDDDRDGDKSPKLFSFSAAEEWEGNSSFTVLYEDALHPDGDESYSFSTEQPEQPISVPNFPLDSSQHLVMCGTSKGKCERFHPYEESGQSNRMPESTCSESFITVEAKRYRVYPFSLSPIYEDDSSQEDLLSTDISPGVSLNEKSRNNQSLSVLSLLQSVSERLKSNNQCNEKEEEEFCGENSQEDEEEDYISSHLTDKLSNVIPEDINEKGFLSKHSHSLSKEACSTKEALSFSPSCSTQLLQNFGHGMKSSSKSIYYESLQSKRSYVDEKGTQFGNILLLKDQQPENSSLQKLACFRVCPVDRERLKCNPRPGKMIICDVHGKINKYEIYHDVVDATAWVLPKEVLIRVIRGCWILYEKQGFQGQKYFLEEGEKMLHDILNQHTEKQKESFTIGSIRQILKNCSVPEIQLYPEGSVDYFPVSIHGAVADIKELEVKNPAFSIKAGVWFAYSDVNYKGEVVVWEENNCPCEISAADIQSLYPLKMGGLKVQMPMNVKIILYEKPHFGGWYKELSENIDCIPILFENANFHGIGSICVIGGIWVAYEKERYKGQQYLLEEGEYEDWKAWGGMNSTLLSLRFLQANFMESEVTLFETDEENGKLLNIVNEEIPDLEVAGYGLVTRSINVTSGAWVAYQQKYFCGEQYILEKGKYKCFFDWGGSSETIMSIRPIKLEPLGNHEPTHWLKAFSNTHFQGSCMDFTTEVADFASFSPCSFKVLRGCWLLHYQENSDDDQCVLEEDLYSDLASCGCPAAAVKSLKPVEYVFAEPFISLFALENCEGRELHLQEAVSSVLNKDLHFLAQSLWVRSGLQQCTSE